MPVVVSQWTSATSVMSGSAASRSATSAAVGGRGLVGLQHAVGARHAPADLDHAAAVGATDQDQQMAVARDQRAELGFHREGAAALYRHAGERLAGGGERE